MIYLVVLTIFVFNLLVYSQYSRNTSINHRDKLQRRILLHHHKKHGHTEAHSDQYSQWDTINDQTVMFVMSTMVQGGSFLRSRIIASARTWMKSLKHVYVIVEDTAETRFVMRYCEISESRMFTLFDCPGETTYLLTRNCTIQYNHASGICCKVDSALQYLILENIELFDKIQYAFVCDDDEYWRMDQVFKWLLLINQTKIHNYPVIGNNYVDSEIPSSGVSNRKGCKEIYSFGFYQPMMLNKLALTLITKSITHHGITQACEVFALNQDEGIGVWAWQMQLYRIHIPHSHGDGRIEVIRPNDMVLHAVKHVAEDKCDGDNSKIWTESGLRYNQTIMVGCGSVDRDVPTHDRNVHIDMYDAYRYFSINGTDVPFYDESEEGHKQPNWVEIDGKKEPKLTLLFGYDKTKHYQDYYNSTEYHPFKPSDCVNP